ncbi:MAG: PAS domain S-box protein [Phormidium sp.]
MQKILHFRCQQYVVTVAVVGLALFLTLLLQRALNYPFYALFYAAVAISAWYGGIGTGILATVLSSLAVSLLNFYLYSQSWSELGRILPVGAFVLVALIIGSLSFDLKIAKRRLEKNLEQLQAREKEFRTLAENSPDIITRLDRNLRHIYVSPAITKATGWKPEFFIGKTHVELGLPEEVHCLWQERLRQTLNAGKPHYFEFYFPAPDGIHYYESRVVPEFAADGSVQSLLGIASDVTERKQTELALRESEELFRQFAENIHDVLWMSDIKKQENLYVSPAYQEIWGRSCTKLKADFNAWIKSIHPDDRERVQIAFSEQILQGSFDEEYRVIRPDGSIRWVRDRGFPIKEISGEIYRAARIVEDITERKLAEEALARSEERFLVAQELSLDAFTILESVRDETGQIVDFKWTYVNPTAARILQKSQEELLGERLLELLPGNKANSELFERYVKVVETGEPHDIELRYESEGIVGWFRNMAVKLDDGVAISFSDVSDRKRAEVEREELLARERTAREQAEAANRIKDEFLAVLSHELRSPLNPILGWSKLLRTRKFDQAATDRALEVIERNAKLQTQLIEDLLDVSRILRGKLSLNIHPVNLVATIDAALETVRLSAEAKSIQIEKNYEPNVGKVLGDFGRLQQVIWNLLSNAVKFTPSGGKIEIYLKQINSHVEIKVKDTGKGIQPDFLPFVFDYFRQADSSITRNFGGLGLGLAIVRHLVELHGGTVGAESLGEGLGATFIVSLPTIDSTISTNEENINSGEAQNLNGVRIIAVDDDADMRDYVKFVLEQAGAEVTVLSSASEVLAALTNTIPDLIIADIGMPNVDGYTLLKQIRKLPKQKGGEILAIALTAYAAEYDQQQAIAAGFQLHLAKPIEPDRLIEAIAKILQLSRLSGI